MIEGQYIPVVWAEGGAILTGLRGKEKKAMFAICGYSKRIFQIAGFNSLEVLVVHNVIIDKEHGKCEEKKRCIDFDCPLNKTTRESYARAFGINPKRLTVEFGKRAIKYNRKSDSELHNFQDILERFQEQGGMIFAGPKRKGGDHE